MIVKISEGIELTYVNMQYARGFVLNDLGFVTPSQIVYMCQEALKRGLTTKEALQEQFKKFSSVPLDTCYAGDLVTVVGNLPETHTLPSYVELCNELFALRKEVKELRAELNKKYGCHEE